MEEGAVFDSFCGSKFWDANLSWYTDDPDLTPCFQRTVLIWVPCLMLWAFSSLEIFYFISSRNRDVPWNVYNLSKLAITLVLGVVCIVDFGYAITVASIEDGIIFNVHYCTPFIQLATFGLAGAFLVLNRARGMTASSILFYFWLLLAACGAVQFRSELNRMTSERENKNSYFFISYMVYYCLVLFQFFLHCFADESPTYYEFPPEKNPCPEYKSSALSRLTFSWFEGLAWLGFRKSLVPDDLWSMNPEETSARIAPKFNKYWNKAVQSAKKRSKFVELAYNYQRATTDSKEGTNEKRKCVSVVWPLCCAFGPTFIFGASLKFISDIMNFINPLILELLIEFVKTGDNVWKGYFYAAAMLIVASTKSLFALQYFFRMLIVGLRIRTSLISAIYRKSLRLSNSSRKESTVGEIVNIMAVDAQRFMEVMMFLNFVWSAPLQIVLALYFLWNILGPSVLAGLAVMIILIPVNSLLANKAKGLQATQMKNKDERVKAMSEILSGIKVLKLYAWEPSFEDQILKIRGKEIKVLKGAAYINAGISFILACTPFLVSLVTLGTYVLLDPANQLDAKITFVSLTYFNIMRTPMNMLSQAIPVLIQASVSAKRINKFLNRDELNPDDVSHDYDEPNPLVIENGTFSWGRGEAPTLKGVNLQIKKGQLAAVVGTIGSGKSSLISALLGEMEKVEGRVNTQGSIAYVSQQSWIQNASLRDNVLFGQYFERRTYNNIVQACALEPDFEMLPAGDLTEIGEKGINLSGGQKQRISLARAVYANADVYYLDDPLSAVDAHVGKQIFENVIGPTGILRHQTRLLVTHSITYLPDVDVIYVLEDGMVSETGTYKQLLKQGGAFAEFIIAHIQESDDPDIDLEEIETQLEGALDVETFQAFKRKISEVRSESISLTLTLSSVGMLSSKTSELSNIGVSQLGQDKMIEIEKIQTGSVEWNVYAHYFRSLSLRLTFGTIIMYVTYQAFSISSNIWLSQWSDASANAENGTLDKGTQDLYLEVYGALGFGQAISNFGGSLMIAQGSVYASIYLHRSFLTRCLRSPLSFFDTTPLGRIIHRFTKDIDVIDNTLPQTMRLILQQFLMVVSTIIVISYTTPIFIAAIIPIIGIYYLIQQFYIATSRQLKRIESVSRSPIYSHFGESVTGAQTIRAYSEEQRFIQESEERVDFNLICFYPSLIASRWAGVRFEMLGNLIIFFAALFAVLNRDTMNPGLVGLSITYALQVTETMNILVRLTTEIENNIVAVERVKEYSETPQEAEWNIPETKPPKGWPTEGEVEFIKYQVRYRDGMELVLKGINFVVRGGEKVAIVGRTGAGKSSLTLGLFRIIEPAAGQILIDGVDITKLGLHDLRGGLTIIPQDPVLFSGTIRLNLDPFYQHSDNEVWKAINHAHLKPFVSQLNLGLNHEVTEGGENLSVGQRQLICLGRALLRKTKVLVLDEATAAVDLETDALIQKTIRTEFKDCTVLTIAHRLNTILDSDRVLVLDKGLVLEYDSPQTLLSRPNSIFASMARDAGIIKNKKNS